MGLLWAYVRLFRLEHAAMILISVLFAMLLSLPSGQLPALPSLLAFFLVPLFIEMGSFAINDYFDVASDRENRRLDRPIASGEIPPKSALLASIICYAAAAALAFLLPTAAFAIAAAFAAASILYSWKMKDLPLLGNAYIAASMAIPFVYGNLAFGSIQPAIASIACVAFVAGLGREIAKSIEDLEGDVKHRKSKTLPAIIGKEKSAIAAAALYAAVVPLSFAPFAFGLKPSTLSAGLVAIAALSFAFLGKEIAASQSKDALERSRKASLFALFLGLLGYVSSLI